MAEDIAMFPLILLGRLMARFHPLKKEYDTFFFFPFYHIGGAEKVHYNIAKAIGNKDCIIFFTRKSKNDLFQHEFAASGCEVRDISRYTDNKWIYFVNIVYRGIITGYINRQKKRPLVFNGQCNFGYKISPWVSKHVPQIELIHSLCSFSYIRIPFLPFIARTVMISTIRIREHLDLYKRYGIPLKLGERIQFIMNAIDLPREKLLPQTAEYGINVLYAGRSTPEKRVHLIAKMASLVRQTTDNVQFTFLGEVKDAIPRTYHSNCHFLGNQSDPQVIADVYRRSQVLVLASDTEGFPMVVMEAMAYGLAVVATAVGEIPLHVKNGINGFLIEAVNDEDAVVAKGVDCILQLYHNKKLLPGMSNANIVYAYNHFGMDRFVKAYKHLANETRQRFSFT